MEVEDARDIVCEDGLVLVSFEAVGMLRVVDEFEEVDDVDEADFEVGKVSTEEGGGGEGFVG